MTREELRAMLERLHEELTRTNAVDEGLRDRLRTLQADIHAVLEREGPDAGLKERLENEVAEFEALHPTLARQMAQVIDTLALYNL